MKTYKLYIGILICLIMIAGCTKKTAIDEKVDKNTDQQNKTSLIQTEKDYFSIIENSKLQYPGSNEQFEYNVYNDYVEITKYIGADTNVIIPDTIEGLPVWIIGGFNESHKIGDYGHFGLCDKNDKLQYVKISDSVIIIQADAFFGCRKLNNIEFGNNVQLVSKYAFYNVDLEHIKFPESLRTIEECAFRSCSVLRTIELNEGLEYIGKESFAHSCISEVTIPKSVYKIEKNAFTGVFLDLDGDGNHHNILNIKGYKGSAAAQYIIDNKENDKYNRFTFEPLD